MIPHSDLAHHSLYEPESISLADAVGIQYAFEFAFTSPVAGTEVGRFLYMGEAYRRHMAEFIFIAIARSAAYGESSKR